MIVVPYSVGAATPSQVAVAAEERGDTVCFVLDPMDAEAVGHRRLLEAFGRVVVTSSVDIAIDELSRLARPSGVVTFSEATLSTAARIAAAFGLPGHDPSTVGWLTDKYEQRMQLNACGVGSVRTARVVTPWAGRSTELPFPGVLKPAAGAGSRDTVFVADAAGVAAALADQQDGAVFVVEQELAGGGASAREWLADYASVESAVVGGQVLHLGITGRLPLAAPARERGLVFPVVLPNQEDVLTLAERAVSALGIDQGLAHTEIKLSDEGPQIIEVNARLGGGLASIMPAAGGGDPVGLALDLALGRPLDRAPEPAGAAAHVYVQAPLTATTLLSAPDPRQLRKLAGVYGVDRRRAVGSRLDWREGSSGRILDVWLKASSIDDLGLHISAALRSIDAAIEWGTS